MAFVEAAQAVGSDDTLRSLENDAVVTVAATSALVSMAVFF